MASPTWVRKMLQVRGIPFEELHHEATFTSQEVAHREHVSGHRVAKVVVVMANNHKPVELVLPASRHVDLALVRRALGLREVRLATEQEMAHYFVECEVGAVPPLRRWEDVEVIMDRSLIVEGDIVFQAGTHTDAIRVNFRRWFEMTQPRVATFAERPEPVGAGR